MFLLLAEDVLSCGRQLDPTWSTLLPVVNTWMVHLTQFVRCDVLIMIYKILNQTVGWESQCFYLDETRVKQNFQSIVPCNCPCNITSIFQIKQQLPLNFTTVFIQQSTSKHIDVVSVGIYRWFVIAATTDTNKEDINVII